MTDKANGSVSRGGGAQLCDTRFDEALHAVEREDDQETATARRRWRNKCLRAYRERQQELVLQLDMVLPVRRQSVTDTRNIGKRALGTSGRVLHTVLEDTIEYLRGLRASGELSTAGERRTESGPTSHREALLQSRSIFVVELENPWLWTITAVGQGAAAFFRDAPLVGSQLVGQSLAHMLRCEDLHTAMKLWSDSVSAFTPGRPASSTCIHLIDFSSWSSSEPVGSSSEHAVCAADDIDRIFDCDPLEWAASVTSSSPTNSSPAPSSVGSFGGMNEPVPQARYMRLEGVQVIPVQGRGAHAAAASPERVLLVGTFGETRPLPPCSMCQHTCCYRAEQAYALEVMCRVPRPVSQPVQLERICHRSDAYWDQVVANEFGWSNRAFQRIWTSGFSRSEFAGMLSNLPPRLLLLVKKLCHAVDVFAGYKQMMLQQGCAAGLITAEQAPGHETQWEEEIEFFDLAERDWEPGQIAWRTKFDDDLANVRVGFEISRSISDFSGYEYSEACIRISRCELPWPFNELELLCWTIDSIVERFLSAKEEQRARRLGAKQYMWAQKTRYVRAFAPMLGKSLLVRTEGVWKQDAFGRATLTRLIMSQCSPEDYDRALQETPELCRPILNRISGHRSGNDLLASAGTEYEQSKMKNMVASEEGLAYLDKLTTVIEHTITPLLQAAEAIEFQMREAQMRMHQAQQAHALQAKMMQQMHLQDHQQQNQQRT